MILFKECLKNNVFPFIIGDDKKAEYYEVLNLAQTEEDYDALENYFKFEQNRYEEQIKDFVIPSEKIQTEK